jgi:hypothetical protein
MSEEEIRKAAYWKWEDEVRPEGAHERHWLEAEEEHRNAGGMPQTMPSDHNSGVSAPSGDDLETRTHKLAQEYLSLGGRRLSKIDDNITDVRQWEADPPSAEEFWHSRIETLPLGDRKQVENLLPGINAR